jgi:hypothetical protein
LDLRVVSVVRVVPTFPLVSNRTVVTIVIRRGLKEVVLGVWGDVFRKDVLASLANLFLTREV